MRNRSGEMRGRSLPRNNSGTIALVAAGLSGIISLVLTFGGLLPWCRRKPPMERGPVQAVAEENGNQVVKAVQVEDADDRT